MATAVGVPTRLERVEVRQARPVWSRWPSGEVSAGRCRACGTEVLVSVPPPLSARTVTSHLGSTERRDGSITDRTGWRVISQSERPTAALPSRQDQRDRTGQDGRAGAGKSHSPGWQD